MSFKNLPEAIKKQLLIQTDDDVYEPIPNTYSITEILRCLRACFYQRTLPKQPINPETASNFNRGNQQDTKITGSFKTKWVRSTYRCRNTPVCIAGRFDFLYKGIINELKNPATLFYVKRNGKPVEFYRKQNLFYCYTNAINEGQVIYFDGQECLKYPIEVTDQKCAELIEEIEGRTLVLWTSLHNGKAPIKTAYPPEPWECPKCSFRETCDNEA